jgi:ferredoxin
MAAPFSPGQLASLICLLRQQGFTVIAPVLQPSGVSVFAEIESLEPVHPPWFAGPPPAFSLKPWLHPPELALFHARRSSPGGPLDILPASPGRQPPRFAFLGVRSCDLAAAALLDRVLSGGSFVDTVYAARRRGSLIVAAACVRPAPECFCASLQTGPRPAAGYDLLLEETVSGGMAAAAGSADGAALLLAVEAAGNGADPPAPALPQRRLSHPAPNPAQLWDHFDHPRWDATAARCLSCGSCTSACPTCFCVTIDESSSLDGAHATRLRRWDSCFTHSFSYIHGGSVRLSAKSRLRQRILHKFAAWPEQFGACGCTGCGRCLAWCPAAIDVTEELDALQTGAAPKPQPSGGLP